jgi:hypothetical protein
MAWCLREHRDKFVFEEIDATTFPQTSAQALDSLRTMLGIAAHKHIQEQTAGA